MIFHQNIRGLYNKTEESLNSWTNEIPGVLCFIERHLTDNEIYSTCIKYYNLGANYCGVVNMVEFAYLCMKLCSQPLR